MRNGTRLSLTCGRCGQPRELIGHICVIRSGRAARRAATPKLGLDFGKCETCKRPVGNPLTHVCAPRSDFKRRRAAEKREKDQARARATANRKGEKHEYQNCKDDDCKRSACVAYKTGWREGYQVGFAEGYDAGYGAGMQAGYSEGFDAGLRSCPGPHGG